MYRTENYAFSRPLQRITRRSRTAYRLTVFWMIAVLLCSGPGCSLKQWANNGLKVGPNYCQPGAAIAEEWQDSPDQRVNLSLPDHVDWWSVFEDPVLNRLVDTARSQNLTLAEAGWRIQQARDLRKIAAGNLFPQFQQILGGYSRNQTSQEAALSLPVRSYDDWTIGGGLAWEVDVWGRYRRAITSADATIQVAEGDYDFILLSLIADVAETYSLYRIFERRMHYVNMNIEIQEGSLRLAEAKAEEGKTGYVSVNLAKSNLEAARALLPVLETGIRQANNTLCLLLGIPTDDLSFMLGDGAIPRAPVDVAVGIPADLLRRRPDIRAAERAMAAQSEKIGIALTDLYPAFTINGAIGWQASDFDNLLESGSNLGSVGPSFQWNILNYGRILANVDLQESGLQALIQSYRNTVLNANKEVEDSIVAFLKSQDQVRHLSEGVRQTREALRLTMLSYQEGKIDFTAVYVLQTQLVTVQDQLVVAQGDIARNLIKLYKALGGGWEVRMEGAPVRGVDEFARPVVEDDRMESLRLDAIDPNDDSDDDSDDDSNDGARDATEDPGPKSDEAIDREVEEAMERQRREAAESEDKDPFTDDTNPPMEIKDPATDRPQNPDNGRSTEDEVEEALRRLRNIPAEEVTDPPLPPVPLPGLNL